MKNFIKKISATLAILAILGASTASAGVSQRDTQLMYNGNFEAGYTAFTDGEGTGTSVPKFEPSASGSLALRATYNSNTTQAWVYTSAVTITATDTAGYSYRIKGMARGDGTLAPRVVRTNSGGAICESLWEGTSSTSTQYFDVVFNTSSCSNRIGFDSATNSAGWVEFDNVSITRYYGKIQNRDANIATDGNMEATGTAGYSSINAATITKEANTWNTAGNQVLRVVNNSVTNKAFTLNPLPNLSAGAKVKVSGRIKSSSSTLRPVIYKLTNGTETLWTGDYTTNVQNFSVVATMSTAGYLAFYCSEASLSSDYCEWDDLSITTYYGKVENRDTQLATNANFENGSTGWNSTATSISEVSPGEGVEGTKAIRITQTSYPSGAYLSQGILTTGATYTVKAMARGDGTTTTRILLGTGTNCLNTALSTSWQPVSCTMTASGNTNLYIGALNSTSNGWAEFDNLSITRAY